MPRTSSDSTPSSGSSTSSSIAQPRQRQWDDFGAADALDLLDWKRQVFALYERIRGGSDPLSAWELWRETRDRLYREHPQSPVPAEQRAHFAGCGYFEYDPRARVLAHVEPSEPLHRDVLSSTGDSFPFSSVGRARFELAGEEQCLPLLWNEGYGGGLFVSFQDETACLRWCGFVEARREGRLVFNRIRGHG